VTQVKRPLVATLVLFIAAITLDRVGVEAGADAISSHAYLIALAAVALPLALPSVRRSSAWILPAAAAGSLVGFSALVGEGVFEPGSIHPATTELAFVALAAWLGHQLATNLVGLEDLMASAAFGESPALDLEDPIAANEIHTEIARGRRHGRPIAVTVLTPTRRASRPRSTTSRSRSTRRFVLASCLDRWPEQLPDSSDGPTCSLSIDPAVASSC